MHPGIKTISEKKITVKRIKMFLSNKEAVSIVYLFVIPTEVEIFNFLINRFPFTRE